MATIIYKEASELRQPIDQAKVAAPASIPAPIAAGLPYVIQRQYLGIWLFALLLYELLFVRMGHSVFINHNFTCRCHYINLQYLILITIVNT